MGKTLEIMRQLATFGRTKPPVLEETKVCMSLTCGLSSMCRFEPACYSQIYELVKTATTSTAISLMKIQFFVSYLYFRECEQKLSEGTKVRFSNHSTKER